MLEEDLVPLPAAGRVYRGARSGAARRRRPVAGACGFDACARYLHDVSNDDTRDAGLDDDGSWVVRRTVIDVVVAPRVPRAARPGDMVRRHRQPVGRAAGVDRGRQGRPGRADRCGSTSTWRR